MKNLKPDFFLINSLFRIDINRFVILSYFQKAKNVRIVLGFSVNQ